MAFFNQLANVVEWNEMRDDVIFWKWRNKELKKGSRIIIRPGQDAILFQNGIIEGIFTDSGSYDVETQIIPFLSTLKGFKFGFNSGLRAEVLFVNVREFLINWGTKSPINIMSPILPGGMPLRMRGTFTVKIQDYIKVIDKIAGISDQYTVDDIKARIMAILDNLLMKWITREGKDMFQLMSYADVIGGGIMQDLDKNLFDIGFTATSFNITNINYPEEIQKRIEQAAAMGMVNDVDKLQRVSMADAMAQGKGTAGGAEMMSMMMMQQMQQQQMQMQQQQQHQSQPKQQQSAPSGDTKFCSECGTKVPRTAKFCTDCGNKLG